MIECQRLIGKGLFKRFTDAEVAELCALMDEKSYEPGEYMWSVKSVSNDLCFIIDGHVELSCPTEFAERRAVMGIFNPGSLVGEASFFGGDDCYISAMAVDRLNIGQLSRERLEGLATSSPALHAKLLGVILMILSRRVVQAYKRLASIF